jgi:acyl-CoA thioester hydrolase
MTKMSLEKSNSSSTAFTFPMRIYWEDTDAGGIVYYANYLKFFERARSEWLRQLGVEQGTLLANEGCMFVVSEIQTKFHSPARIDDLLHVTVRIEKLGHASIQLRQSAYLQKSNVIAGDTTPTSTPTSVVSSLSTSSELSASPAQLTRVCDGWVRLACVQQTSMRPAAIPKSIVSRLN